LSINRDRAGVLAFLGFVRLRSEGASPDFLGFFGIETIDVWRVGVSGSGEAPEALIVVTRIVDLNLGERYCQQLCSEECGSGGVSELKDSVSEHLSLEVG
jgi:hypothetical protein